MSSDRKQFIITVGPTGSGKGRVVSSYNPFIQQAIKSHDPSYYTRGLDDLVQESDDYIHRFDKEFLPDFQIFFKDNYSTKDGNIKKSLGTRDIDRLSRELGIKPREGCFTRGRIDELIEDPELNDESCAVRSPIKSSMDSLYFRVRKTKNQDGLTYPQQNEVLVDRALREGKNIIFEITGENVDTVKALCDLPVETGKGPTLFSFPGTRAYRENLEYTHEYEIILLIPYTHTWLLMSRINSRFIKQLHEYILDYDIRTGEPRQAPRIVNIETERGLIDRVSKIYENLQMIIENRCVDTLLLYDNNRNPPSKLLTIFFNDSDKKGRCIKNPRNRQKYNRWKRESVDIPSFTRYIGKYCSDHQSGGWGPGSKGPIASWIYDATEDCFRSLTALYNDPAKKAQYGLLGNINDTFSFFNIGLTWVNKIDGADYYIATVRAIGYPVTDGTAILPNGVPLTSKRDGIAYANENYLYWIDKTPDERPYVDYAGDIYNKWYSPFGWWRAQQDITLVLLYKREGGRLTVIDQSICNSIVDARVFCTYVKSETAIGKKTNSIITGSLPSGRVSFNHALNDEGRCIELPRGEKNPWGKQGMVHVFTNTTDHDSTIIPRMTDPSMIGPCLSKKKQEEKNYAMMYFHKTSDTRFRTGKGVLLHYHMTRENPGGLSGNIFYFKEIDFEKYPDADLSSPEGWEKIVPKDSDIFIRFSNYYSEQTDGKHKDNFGRVSCTTPLNTIEYSKGKKYITGVGHLKINIWRYLITRINPLINIYLTVDSLRGLSYEQIKDRITDNLDHDHVYRFYKDSLLPWVKAYIWDSQDHIDKYTAFVNPYSDYWSNITPSFLYNHTEEATAFSILRDILLEDGFYRIENGVPRIIRHLHPHYIYFMIIYRLNYDDLTVKDFSNPFMIMKEPTSSFLNFPMGLTTNKDDIWISYGDGDCKSYIASFTKDKIDKLCKNNNSTPVDEIHFDMYDDL
jgi:hypothetical protein